mgnify:CR=1 FL=1
MAYKYPVEMAVCNHYPTKIRITGASHVEGRSSKWFAHCVRCGWMFEFVDVAP